MKRLIGLILVLGTALGGCVYDPAYYHRSSVVYDDDYGAYSRPYSYGGYYAPYYAEPWYGYGYGWPYVSLGFYGYYGGGHHHHWNGGTTHHHH